MPDSPLFEFLLILIFATLSPYETLDIEETASPDAIKKKYRQLSLC